MRKTMKLTLAALGCLTLAPTALAETRVASPIAGTVTATTYYTSGSFHGAVDIGSTRCNLDPVLAPFGGYWNVTVRTNAIACDGSGSTTQNEARRVLPDGFSFRLWHFIKTADSYSRTCDGCALGNVGATGNVTSPLVHLQLDLNGTNDTSWYAGYTLKGEFLDARETVGYF